MRTVKAIPNDSPVIVASITIITIAPEGEVLISDESAYAIPTIETVVVTLRGMHNDVDEEEATFGGIVEDMIGKLEQ